MQTKLTAHPHTAKTVVLEDQAGKPQVRIHVSLNVPSRVAAMLAENGRFHVIPSATFLDEKDIKERANNWTKRPRNIKRPATKEFLSPAIADGCDTKITVQMSVENWHFAGRVCGMLDITPGQWLLACAAYNAAIEEERIEAQLAEIPAGAADPKAAE